MCRDLHRLDDHGLVRELRARCPAALAEVDRRYGGRLRRHGARLLRGTGSDPDDLVQDTLVRTWTALPRSGDVDLQRWLHTVLRNRAIDVRRRHAASELPLVTDPPEPRGDVLAHVIAGEALRETVRMVAALPPRQREALVRTAIDGESHRSTARAMATSEAATKLLVSRARHRLAGRRDPSRPRGGAPTPPLP